MSRFGVYTRLARRALVNFYYEVRFIIGVLLLWAASKFVPINFKKAFEEANEMAISLEELNSEKADLRIELNGGGELNVIYNPQAYNAETENAFQTVADTGRPVASLSKLLAALLVEWDLTQVKGGPNLPVTPEIIDRLGVKVLNALVLAIMEDMRPEKK